MELDSHLVQSRTAQSGGTSIFRYFSFYLGDIVGHDSQIQNLILSATANRHCWAY